MQDTTLMWVHERKGQFLITYDQTSYS